MLVYDWTLEKKQREALREFFFAFDSFRNEIGKGTAKDPESLTLAWAQVNAAHRAAAQIIEPRRLKDAERTARNDG
jgi:hypothetical protein